MSIIHIDSIVAFANASLQCDFRLIPGKRIMYQAVKDGKTLCMVSPMSSYHPDQGCYWVDLTEVQLETLDQYDSGFLLFRLEGMKLMMAGWPELRPLLDGKAMTNNLSEGNHWKLRLYNDGIRVMKSGRFLPCKILTIEERSQ